MGPRRAREAIRRVGVAARARRDHLGRRDRLEGMVDREHPADQETQDPQAETESSCQAHHRSRRARSALRDHPVHQARLVPRASPARRETLDRPERTDSRDWLAHQAHRDLKVHQDPLETRDRLESRVK